MLLRITKLCLVLTQLASPFTATVAATGLAVGGVNVLTYHNDGARTGQNLNETILALNNVNSNSFGKLLIFPVEGDIFAQPLYVPGVAVPGRGLRNLVLAVTEEDSVYAFDADGLGGADAGPIWQDRFIDPAAGISAVPLRDVGLDYDLNIGITGTPVIDPSTQTLYVVAKTKETQGSSITYAQRLHALDLATGAEKFGGPALIEASVPGLGDGSDSQGNVPFNALYQLQRCGLALLNGVVYIAFASAGDIPPYHGWLLGYDAQTLKLVQVFNDTPNDGDGGIWMSGGAPAIDRQGNILVITGNGGFDADTGGPDYGDSFVKLTPSGNTLQAADFFTPFDESVLDQEDGDLGSGGVLVLPDSAGSLAHPHLAAGAGKSGTIYLLDVDNMGRFNPTNDSQIVVSLDGALPGGLFSTPAFFRNWLYFCGPQDMLKAYSLSSAQMSSVPVSQAPDLFGYPGATPSISANGSDNGIAWVLQSDALEIPTVGGGPEILRAYNATNLAQELYDSTQAGPRDQMGPAEKFPVPTIANGRVYAATASGVEIFGHIGAPVVWTAPSNQVAIAGQPLLLSVVARGSLPLDFQWQYNGTNIAGATNTYLLLDSVTLDQAGQCQVVIRNSFGSVTTPSATISVASLNLYSDAAGLTLAGPSGTAYRIDSLSELAPTNQWTALTNVVLATKPLMFIDPTSTNSTARFYRVISTSPTR